MTYIEANGARVNYELSGPVGAPVVTLSHSLATNLEMWEPQMGALLPRFRVLRYDTRGHGGSEASPPPYSFAELAEDARALLAELSIERTHFVGISLGGMIGQHLALAHPEVLAGLVLADTTGRTPAEASPTWDERIETALTAGMEAHVEPTIERWFTLDFIEQHAGAVDPIRDMIRTTSVEGYVGCAAAVRGMDLLDRLSALKAPTLIIVGDQDPATPVSAAEQLHDRIAGSELALLESASHLSNVERPHAFNRALLDFLGRHL